MTRSVLVCALIAVCCVFTSVCDASLLSYDLGAGKPYAIIQLGNGLGGDASDDDNLDITSNSSIFGSTLKGRDDKPLPDFQAKLSTSKVTGSWDVETGVIRDKTMSRVLAGGGTENDLTSVQMAQVRTDALNASTFWAGEPATNLSAAQHSALDGGAGLTGANALMGTTGGANVFNSTDDFKVNGTVLELNGGPGDFFVFNIFPSQVYNVVSSAEIRLSGDIEPEEVLFNVLGDVGGGGQDDALISGNSLFRGTLLAPERNVLVMQNHFDTFVSSGLLDDDGGTDAPSTTAISWQTATEGLFGQIVSGGKITWSESDISQHSFMTMPIPEPSSFALFAVSLSLGASARNRRR